MANNKSCKMQMHVRLVVRHTIPEQLLEWAERAVLVCSSHICGIVKIIIRSIIIGCKI